MAVAREVSAVVGDRASALARAIFESRAGSHASTVQHQPEGAFVITAVFHPRETDPSRNVLATEKYSITVSLRPTMTPGCSVIEHLDERHEARIREQHGMARRTLDNV